MHFDYFWKMKKVKRSYISLHPVFVISSSVENINEEISFRALVIKFLSISYGIKQSFLCSTKQRRVSHFIKILKNRNTSKYKVNHPVFSDFLRKMETSKHVIILSCLISFNLF